MRQLRPYTVTTVQSGAAVYRHGQHQHHERFLAGALRPNVSGDPKLSNPTVSQWFNTSVLSQPAAYQFGNEGAGILGANGLKNVDVSVQRTLKVRERYQLEFRAEGFNSFNHTDFGLPGSVFGAPNFGVVTSAGVSALSVGAPRQIELGLHLGF